MLGPCVEIQSSAFEVSITGVLVACAVWTSIIPSATISLPRVFSVAWAFLTSAVTFIIGFFVGLATSHVCPWAGRHGSYWLVGYHILDRLVVHRWLGAGRWRTRSKVRAFRRISMSGSPLPRTGRCGDSWLTPFSNLLMPDGWRTPREKMITIALRKRTLSPVRTCSEGYIFLLLFATVVFLWILGSIN